MLNDNNMKPIRVLSLSGGGMRGFYSATYLHALSTQMAKKHDCGNLDIGSSFNLITGTSTGGILACALATGIPMSNVANLYKEHGKEIFPKKLPTGFIDLIKQLRSRSQYLAEGEAALQKALVDVFEDTTIKDVYDRRGIALAVPAVEMTRHASWVFKSAHLQNSNHRDDHYSLVDVCLATSAAPLFRSMASIKTPDSRSHSRMFVDGGLWANDPIFIGLIDALEMAQEGQPIEIYCLGTCKRPEGESILPDDRHRGLWEWKFGGYAASLSIDAQEFAYSHMVRMLAKHLKNEVKVIRFPSEPVSAASLKYLELDATSDEAMKVLEDQAYADMNISLSRIGDVSDGEGQLLEKLFATMKEREAC